MAVKGGPEVAVLLPLSFNFVSATTPPSPRTMLGLPNLDEFERKLKEDPAALAADWDYLYDFIKTTVVRPGGKSLCFLVC